MMKKRLLILLIFIKCVTTFPVVAQQITKVDTVATRYILPKADCACFPATAKLPLFLNDSIRQTKRFTPSKQQIITTEKALIEIDLARVNKQPENSYYANYPAIITEQLSTYQRQYFGFYNSQGHPCLYINFFILHLEEPADYTPFWLTTPVRVYDGGAAFWSIFFDLETHKFYGFRHNSEG